MQFVSTLLVAIFALIAVVSAQSISIVPSSYTVVGGTAFTVTLTASAAVTGSPTVSLTYNGITITALGVGTGTSFVATFVAPLAFTGAGVLNATAVISSSTITAASVTISIIAPVVPVPCYNPCYNPCNNPCYNPCARRSRCGRYEDENASESAVEFVQDQSAESSESQSAEIAA